MIRPATSDDSVALVALAVAAGLFGAQETEPLAQVLADHFAGAADEGDVWLVDLDEAGLRGVAYYSPAPMTDGTWYLKMIAVRPERQGQGYGTALMRHVEDALRQAGQRVLLVETSGLPEFARTRAFYARCGYDEEARVREYYKAGEDMVLFRKALTAKSPATRPGSHAAASRESA
jgi:ribosomal protein S18 acetylase RimI-like enzyme